MTGRFGETCRPSTPKTGLPGTPIWKLDLAAPPVDGKANEECVRFLAELVGVRHTIGAHAVYALDAARLARATVAELRALQFTTRKAEYLITVAQGVADGSLDLEALAAARGGCPRQVHLLRADRPHQRGEAIHLPQPAHAGEGAA